MMKFDKRSATLAMGLALGAVGAMPVAQAAIVISSAGQSYAQNFDTLTATNSTGQTWTNDSTLTGWSLFRQPAPGTALTAYGGDNGGGNAGSFYSYGSTGSTDRALGGLGSGGAYFGSPGNPAVAGWIAAEFNNTSGQNLSGFSVNFDGEQWRNGGNTAAQSAVFEYGFGSTFAGVSWTAPGGLFNWASTVNTATAAAVDGNVAGKVANRGGTVNAAWNAGSTLWVRWIENNDAGNDHGLAIDNFSLTAGAAPSAVPLPPAVALMAAGISVMGWLGRRRKQG